MSLPDKAVVNLLHRQSRQTLAKIWKAGQAGEPLTGDDARLYKAMLEHPEFHDYWEQLDYIQERDIRIGGVSPPLHVALHCVVETQYEQANPPEVRDAIHRLMHRGMDRHEAVHRVGSIFAKLLWEALSHGRPFPLDEYRRRLCEL